MKLKNGEMAKSTALYNSNSVGVKLPFSTLYKVKKNFCIVQNALTPFYETLKSIQNDYASNKIDKADADKAIAELSNIEFDADIETIPLEEFGDVEVSPQLIEALYFMIG